MPLASLVLDLQAAVTWLGTASGLPGLPGKRLLRCCDVQDSALPEQEIRGAAMVETEGSFELPPVSEEFGQGSTPSGRGICP